MSTNNPLDPDQQKPASPAVSVTTSDEENLLEELPIGLADEVEQAQQAQQNVSELEELPVGLADEAEPTTAKSKPKVSISSASKPPTVGITNENPPTVSIDTAPKTSIAAKPKPAPDTTLNAKNNDEEVKSKMAEVKAPVGEKEVFERLMEMLLGALQVALAVTAVAVAGACAVAGGALMVAGGALGWIPGVGAAISGLGNMMMGAASASMGLAAHAAKEHPAVQEYMDRFVKVPKAGGGQGAKATAEPEVKLEADKPAPASNELASRLGAAQEQMTALNKQPQPGEMGEKNREPAPIMPLHDAEKSKVEPTSAMVEKMDAKAKADAVVQQNQQPELDTSSATKFKPAR